MRKIDCVTIHHSASHSGNVAEFAAEHKIKFGIEKVGYHFVIGNGHGLGDGIVQAGRPVAEKGVGVFGANTGKIHICLVGQFAPECKTPKYAPPTSAQLRSLGVLLLKLFREHHLSYTQAKGHKEVAVPGHGTLCPGNLKLQGIRLWLQGMLKAGPSPGPLDLFLADKPSGVVSTPGAQPGTITKPPFLEAHRTSLIVQVVKEGEPGSTLVECRDLDQGNLWVPLKAIAVLLGYQVDWDSVTKIATVSTPEQPTE